MTSEKLQPKPSNEWWGDIISKFDLPEEYWQALLRLDIRKEKDGILTAQTPDGRREVNFTTINFVRGVAYRLDNDSPQCFFPIPNLPWEEITRGGIVDKRHWGWTLEEKQEE